MKSLTCIGLLLLALGAATAWGDTVQLKSGIQVDGKIVSQNDESITVNAGGNTVVYRTEEILKVEPNERTGELNMEEVQREVAAYEQKLQSETGATMKQHTEIQALLVKAQSTDENESGPAKDQLVELGKTVPLFRYLERFLPEYTSPLVPPVLEVMFRLDPAHMPSILRAHCTDKSPRSRATALKYLGEAKDAAATELVARGLVDYDYDVLCAATTAAGQLGLQAATPLMVARLDASGEPLVLASEKALSLIWGGERPADQTDRKAFWLKVWEAKAASVPVPYDPATLQRLAEPAAVFVHEDPAGALVEGTEGN